MAIGTGLGGQIGFAEEVTYGTYVAPTRFMRFDNEKIAANVGSIQSFGIGRGRWLRTGRHKEYIKDAAGQVQFDVMSKGYGMLLKHALGSYANVLVVGSEQKATITPDPNGLAGLSLTCQVGRPSIDGTVQPFSYSGGKVKAWELKNGVDNQLTLMLDLDFKTVVTSQGLAAATYVTGDEIFIFSECTLTINGVTVFAKNLDIKGDNGLDVARRFIGNTKKEPLAAAQSKITGQLDFEFEDLTKYAAWVAGTEIATLVATYTTPTVIAGGGNVKFIVTIPNLIYTGAQPDVAGPAIVPQQVPFEALYDGTNPIITIEQRTTDTAA